MNGNRLGRVQPLASSASAGVLFEKGRARNAAERAAQAVDNERLYGDMRAALAERQ